MRKIQRLVAAGAMVALSVTLSACGGVPSTENPVTPAPSATTVPDAGSGVTTTSNVFGPMCAQLPQAAAPGSLDVMAPMPVASAAGSNPELQELTKALRAAGLVDTLNGQKEITVFAPYDSAFDETHRSLGDARYQQLLADKDALGSVLKYHVIAKRYNKDGLITAGSTVTLSGGALQFKVDGDSMTVTDSSGQVAHVLCGNIPTANATVFVIDKVLMTQPS
ncbi:MAG TPA: fasciclin domain-containing protein [Pseudonocardia sp.]